MSVEAPDQAWWNIFIAGCSFAGGSLLTFLGHLFQSRASMAALVDARIRLLIKGYESRIADLQDEIKRLEDKVDALTKALDEERTQKGFGV
jgi:uncharacterized small protein (DUF1192 family)